MINAVMLDPERFPSLSRYLLRLPEGIDSYPECQAKGSMVRSALEGHELGAELEALPRQLVDLVETPPPATRWVPLVHAESIFHLVCDRYYPTQDDMLQWTYDRSLKMGSSKLYRKLFAVAGPGVLLKIAVKVHGLFERGTDLSVTVSGKSAVMELVHPPHVHSPLNHAANIAMVNAIIDITGGKDGECVMTRSRSDGAKFECSWR